MSRREGMVRGSFWRETCSIQLLNDLFRLESWAETLLVYCQYPFVTVVFRIEMLVALRVIVDEVVGLAWIA